MARSITTRSTNPKIMDDNIKILDDALAASTPEASDVSYDNTDSGLTAENVQAAIDELTSNTTITTFEESKTSSEYGVIITDIPVTKPLLGYLFSTYLLVPFNNTSTNTWAFSVVDIDANNLLKAQANKSGTLVAYYMS